MNNNVERATKRFLEDYNCAQSVLSTFGPELGLDYNICFKIACPFGAGIARKQEICGAVTGAIMVLGLKYGRGEEDGQITKEKNYQIVLEFISKFEERNNTINCFKLLGYDMNTEEGRKIINEQDLFHTVCVNFVKDAVEIIDELLDKY